MPVYPIIQRVINRAYRQGHNELPLKTVEEVRQYYQKQAPKLVCDSYEEHEVYDGVKLRVHRPRYSNQFLPVVLYFRASAFVLGRMEDSDFFCHYLAKHLRCVVIAIEPRLAPEFKFPIPFNDSLACIKFIYNHHENMKINIKKMAVWGESSGGNLAAALCHYLKSEKINIIKNQILFYPLLDCYPHNEYNSKKMYSYGYLMDDNLRNWFLNQYLNLGDYEDVRVSPLLANDFSSLPHTIIIGAQYDPMRDESVLYIEKLRKSDVRVNAVYFPGMIHGFLWYAAKLKNARFSLTFATSILKEEFLKG